MIFIYSKPLDRAKLGCHVEHGSRCLSMQWTIKEYKISKITSQKTRRTLRPQSEFLENTIHQAIYGLRNVNRTLSNLNYHDDSFKILRKILN